MTCRDNKRETWCYRATLQTALSASGVIKITEMSHAPRWWRCEASAFDEAGFLPLRDERGAIPAVPRLQRALFPVAFLEQTLFFRLLASGVPLALFVPAESPDQSSAFARRWLRSDGWV